MLAKHPRTGPRKTDCISAVSVPTLPGSNQTIASQAGDFMTQFASCQRVDSDGEEPRPRSQPPPVICRDRPSSKFHRHKEAVHARLEAVLALPVENPVVAILAWQCEFLRDRHVVTVNLVVIVAAMHLIRR